MLGTENVQAKQSAKLNHALIAIAVAITLFFVVLRFFHLEADFPHNYTKSGVLYTDEGAYSNAAIAYIITGHWYVEGDFNTVINLPLFPLFQLLSFKAFGLSSASGRLTVLIFFVLLLIVLFILVRRYSNVRVALITIILVAVNFNAFAYSRLNILEIPMTFWLVLSILLASLSSGKRQSSLIIVSGFIFSLAVLTKTTAVFALPALIYLIFTENETTRGKISRLALFFSPVAIVLILYYFALVKPHLADYHFYNSTNIYMRTRMDPLGFARAMAKMIYYGRYIDIILYPMVALYSIFFIFKVKEFRMYTLFWIAVLWIAAYILLVGTQHYTPPRYYTPLVFPIAIIAATIVDYFWEKKILSFIAVFFGAALLFSLASNGVRIIHYIGSPEYSWSTMTRDIKHQIEADGCDNPVLLGGFSTSISLSTGIFSINDWKGTWDLSDRIQRYKPNYYVCLGSIKDDIRVVLEGYYDIEKISQYDVYENYLTGEPVVLYRLIQKQETQASTSIDDEIHN